MGRKKTLFERNPELRARILLSIGTGLPMKTALQLAGVKNQYYYVWKARAEKGEEPFRTFFQECMIAETQGEAGLLQAIHNDKSWQSKAWILERRWPERWHKKDNSESAIDGTDYFDIDIGDLAEATAEAAEILKREKEIENKKPSVEIQTAET